MKSANIVSPLIDIKVPPLCVIDAVTSMVIVTLNTPPDCTASGVDNVYSKYNLLSVYNLILATE